MTVDSTGDTQDDYGDWNNGGPKTYTLTVDEDKIDLSKKNLGSADVALVATWLQRPEVMAALARLNLKDNREIGASGADPLMESICTTRNTCIVSIEHDVGAFVYRFLATCRGTLLVLLLIQLRLSRLS